MYTLMIVDDSSIIRNRIERCMDKLELNVVAMAENGEEAVEMFKKHRPDLVTMDMTMPKMDGLECIKQLCALSDKTNILVISALSDRPTGLRALQYGARGYISKPFTDEQLVMALSKLIARIRK